MYNVYDLDSLDLYVEGYVGNVWGIPLGASVCVLTRGTLVSAFFPFESHCPEPLRRRCVDGAVSTIGFLDMAAAAGTSAAAHCLRNEDSGGENQVEALQRRALRPPGWPE